MTRRIVESSSTTSILKADKARFLSWRLDQILSADRLDDESCPCRPVKIW
jgi:hypothetical protein